MWSIRNIPLQFLFHGGALRRAVVLNRKVRSHGYLLWVPICAHCFLHTFPLHLSFNINSNVTWRSRKFNLFSGFLRCL